MIKYKLTNKDIQTRNNTQWQIGQTRTSSGENPEICTEGWLHYYHHPLLAVLIAPKYSNFKNPRLFECEAEGQHIDHYGLKGACTKLTLIREIILPQITTTQKTAFAILCAKEVYQSLRWNKWANDWLSGKDRSITAATNAANAAAKTNKNLDLISIAQKAMEY